MCLTKIHRFTITAHPVNPIWVKKKNQEVVKTACNNLMKRRVWKMVLISFMYQSSSKSKQFSLMVNYILGLPTNTWSSKEKIISACQNFVFTKGRDNRKIWEACFCIKRNLPTVSVSLLQELVIYSMCTTNSIKVVTGNRKICAVKEI